MTLALVCKGDVKRPRLRRGGSLYYSVAILDSKMTMAWAMVDVATSHFSVKTNGWFFN
jgi:hypothetical protein